MPCNHKFNYDDLVKAVIKQKIGNNYLNITKLKNSEIQCPYCRTIHNKLLPFIPTDFSSAPIKGINSPSKYCMTCYPCSWIYKSGKNKNTQCCKNGYEGEKGVFCKTHHKIMEKVEILPAWNNSMDTYKKYTVAQLKDILHEKNLKKTGNKTTLILRIINAK